MKNDFDIDGMVVGAGVIGLAIGRALALAGTETIVVDRHSGFGMETSSRNSEVIHAGIYYPAGSLKAKFCLHGRRDLYEYLEQRAIPHRRCGKLIVASGHVGEAGLAALKARAAACGVEDLVNLTQRQAISLEPALSCSAALHSPSTGIVDSHALMQSYVSDLEANGGQFVANTQVDRVEVLPAGGFRIWLAGEAEPLKVRLLVNAAGLWADQLAFRIDCLAREQIPTLRFARGVYFSLANGKSPFSRLVYPLPDNASLGIHSTLDLAGSIRFGPDVEWINDPLDYTVDASRASVFAKAISSYWPDISEDALVPAYSGIRPKLCGPGDPPSDFRIDGPQQTNVPGLCCLYGIESPGLTASLAIGQHVSDLLTL